MALIIAVFQRPRVLELVLASLGNQTLRDFEVVVADDGSGPEIGRVIEHWPNCTPWPVQHVWQENQGFRKTVIANRAVAAASGQYLVFIDGDCILHHRFMERHHDRRRARQVLSGRRVMLDAALSERLSADDVTRRRIERPSTWWRHVKAHDRRNGFCVPAAFGWRGGFSPTYEILGSNFSMFRADLLEVNGYDERIVGRGLEDVNLRARLLNAGFAIRSISQEAVQYHCHHGTEGFPHDAAAVERWSTPRESRTVYGIAKLGPPNEAAPRVTTLTCAE